MTTYAHPDFSQPVNYDIQYVPATQDGQVSGTISMMRRYAIEDSNSPILFQRMKSQLAGVEINDYSDVLQAAYDAAKQDMYFQRDETTGGPLDPDVVEVLIRPVDVALMAQSQPVPGDCDCFSMYLAGLLTCVGVPCSFVTTSADGHNPGVFSHVYLVAFPDDPGKRTVMDASHGPRMGWEAPNMGRYKEWPLMSGDTGACTALGILSLLISVAGLWWAWNKYKSPGGFGMREDYA